MLRTTIDNAYLKRTIRELYSFGATTPKDCLLDPSWARTTDIYPGMGVVSFSSAASGISELVKPPSAAAMIPYGLIGVYCAPALGIDEVRDSGINGVPVWVLGPGSEFEILAPAFDSNATWTFPTDGTELLVYVQTVSSGSGATLCIPGALCPAGRGTPTTKPIARAIARPATDRLIIAGLNSGAAY
jgi:hypothetical protein